MEYFHVLDTINVVTKQISHKFDQVPCLVVSDYKAASTLTEKDKAKSLCTTERQYGVNLD